MKCFKIIYNCVFCVCFFVLAAGCSSKKVETLKPPEIENVKISEFVLGPGDTIEISVYRNDDLKKTVKIDQSGVIMFPLIGDIRVSDKSIFGIRDEIRDRLAKYIIDPQVTINVSSIQSRKVMVLGSVNNPGVFALDSNITVLEAITRAGGMTQDAKAENVLLIRQGKDKRQVASLNLKMALDSGMDQNVYLKEGDIIYLPQVRIANVSWYFSHLSKILSPIVSLESGIVLWPQAKDVLLGNDRPTTPLFIPAN